MLILHGSQIHVAHKSDQTSVLASENFPLFHFPRSPDPVNVIEPQFEGIWGMLSWLGIVDSSIAAQADGAKTGNSKANNEATAFSHLLSWVGATSELKLRRGLLSPLFLDSISLHRSLRKMQTQVKQKLTSKLIKEWCCWKSYNSSDHFFANYMHVNIPPFKAYNLRAVSLIWFVVWKFEPENSANMPREGVSLDGGEIERRPL